MSSRLEATTLLVCCGHTGILIVVFNSDSSLEAELFCYLNVRNVCKAIDIKVR